MKLLNETKLGLRAAVATLATLLVTAHVFNLPRSYWAILTTMALVSASWGETVMRAWYRIGMTIVGCAVGTALWWWLGPTDWLWLILLVASWLVVFYLPVSYAKAMFGLGVTVVMLFSLIGMWNNTLLLERIYETIIGAIVAVLVTRVVLPQRAQSQLSTLQKQAIDAMCTTLRQCRDAPDDVTPRQLGPLNQIMVDLRAALCTAQYELFFIPKRKQDVQAAVRQLDIAHFNLTQLVTAWYSVHTEALMQAFAQLSTSLMSHLTTQATHIAQGKPALAQWLSVHAPTLQAQFTQTRCANEYSAKAFMLVTAYFYWLGRIDEALSQLAILKAEQS